MSDPINANVTRMSMLTDALGLPRGASSASIRSAFARSNPAVHDAVAAAVGALPGSSAVALMLEQFLVLTDSMPDIIRERAAALEKAGRRLGLNPGEIRACRDLKCEPSRFVEAKRAVAGGKRA